MPWTSILAGAFTSSKDIAQASAGPLPAQQPKGANLIAISKQGGREAKKARQTIMKLDQVQCEGSASKLVAYTMLGPPNATPLHLSNFAFRFLLKDPRY